MRPWQWKLKRQMKALGMDKSVPVPTKNGDAVMFAEYPDLEPGTFVRVLDDEGPPGIDGFHGWLGLVGVVRFSAEARAIGLVMVEHYVDELPVPIEYGHDTILFVYDPGQVEAIKPTSGGVANAN